MLRFWPRDLAADFAVNGCLSGWNSPHPLWLDLLDQDSQRVIYHPNTQQVCSPSGLFHTRTLIAITSPRINYRLSNYVLYTHPHITRYIGTAVRISKLILKQLLSYNFKKRARNWASKKVRMVKIDWREKKRLIESSSMKWCDYSENTFQTRELIYRAGKLIFVRLHQRYQESWS